MAFLDGALEMTGQALPQESEIRHVGSLRELLGIAGLLVFALALREASHLGSGRIAGACDEPFVQQILPMLQSGNPLHFEVFFYPPVPAFIVAAFAAVWRSLGGGADIAVQCGAIGLLFSVATVGVVGMLGRFWGKQHGLIAMALYAVTMIAVVLQGNVQVYSTFFSCLALYCILRTERDGRMRILVWAGIWLGLAVASKYSPIFFGGILFVPYALQRWAGKPVPDNGMVLDTRKNEGTFVPRIWTASSWTLVVVTCATLWITLTAKPLVYTILRHIYERYSHENPFEYHLPWIDRLYYAAIAGVGLVGLTAGVALLIPWLRGMPPWAWARSFFGRNRLWVAPCLALIATIAITIGLPVAFNLNDFARHFVFIAKSRATGDNGIFPEFRPAPSNIGAYIPESIGLPLFVAGLVGMLYVLIRRDKRALILIASAIPVYVALELNRVKVNRFVLELLPLWCLLAAIWVADLIRHRCKAWRIAGLVMAVGIVTSSAAYSLAWAGFFSPRGNVQREAGRWLHATLPPGTSLGARSALLVTGSPELLPDQTFLAPYRLLDYTDRPEYVLLPTVVHEIMLQNLRGLQEGYVYTASDWFPSAPTAEDLTVLAHIVGEDEYVLVKEFRKRPVLFGVEIGSHSLSGRTWYAEHNAASGIRVYRRILNHQ